MLKEHRSRLADGDSSFVFWGRGRNPENECEWKFANEFGCKIHAILDRLTGKHGFYSSFATRKLLQRLECINPDVIHLHNIHGYYINIVMLFQWLVEHDCLVEWTLHDCWAFTGHCAYFTSVNCTQWKQSCAELAECPQLKTYPKTYSKGSCRWNYRQKRKIFTQLPADRLKIITPSKWLADLTRESFLSKYTIEVRHNTIDSSVFKETPCSFRTYFDLGNKFLILGVASPWSDRKGLTDFIRLANDLDSARFAILLVGLSKTQIDQIPDCFSDLIDIENVDFSQSTRVHTSTSSYDSSKEDSKFANEAPSSFIGKVVSLPHGGRLFLMPKTECASQLAALYSSSNVLFNPTIEDNFPTVNLEAESCKTPVITYDTGGCAETINLFNSRCVKNYAAALGEILKLSKLTNL